MAIQCDIRWILFNFYLLMFLIYSEIEVLQLALVNRCE